VVVVVVLVVVVVGENEEDEKEELKSWSHVLEYSFTKLDLLCSYFSV
jgi:hypothetical protein